MNRSEHEVAAEERLFEVMLGEVVRGPVAVVHGGARTSRWLAVAGVLLGLVVVVGVVVTSRSEPSVAAAPQEPAPLPPVVTVREGALPRVDRQVENLSCEVGSWPDLGPLQEFPRLRALRIELEVTRRERPPKRCLWSLAPLAQCATLETLSLGFLGRFTAAELAPIGALPNLRLLEVAGSDKVVDGEFAAVLHKLPLRSLALHRVSITPEGFRSLGELPLLERLELRDCTGLEKCDLTHLYRLRQLRALTLRGLYGSQVQPAGEPVAQPDGRVLVTISRPSDYLVLTTAWMRGLAAALPDLRELDLAENSLGDDVLLTLPKRLTRLGMHNTLGYGERGIAAVGALHWLRDFACGVPLPIGWRKDCVPLASWMPMLRQKKLHRIEFTGFPTDELVAALQEQPELRELRLNHSTKFSFQIVGNGLAGNGGGQPGEDPLPDLSCLANLRNLQRIELLQPSDALDKAIRQAVGDRVRVDLLQR